MARKSWSEKMQPEGLPKIVRLDEKQSKRLGGAKTMVVPHPRDVYEIMAQVPRRHLLTVPLLRQMLAGKYNTDTACPLTTGIFIWIAANASQEKADKGEIPEPIPWRRTLKAKGELVAKYPGGIEGHASHLETEGFHTVQKGEKFFVSDYQQYLL